MTTTAAEHAPAPKGKRERERTCVGCHATDERDALVRLVGMETGNGESRCFEVVVDAAGGAFGRGVHVHARPDCIERAAKGGLAKSLRGKVNTQAGELAAAIADAFARRATGLLQAARRSKRLVVGADAAVAALEEANGKGVVVMATDAAHAARLSPVQKAVSEGRAVAWLDRAALGAALGRDEVAVCVVTDTRIGAELVSVCQVRTSVASVMAVGVRDSRGEACKSREVR